MGTGSDSLIMTQIKPESQSSPALGDKEADSLIRDQAEDMVPIESGPR